MADLQMKISKFKNLNIIKYLNETLPRFEQSVILADLNYIEKLRKEIDTEIFKAFLLNSDSLLDVLLTHESVKSNLNQLEDAKTDLRKFSFNLESIQEINFVDKNRLEEFRNVLENFTSETDSFDTGTRVLVHFDTFFDEKDDKNIFILTNDILIIGKIDPQIRKYQLVNAFSYSIVDIQINNEYIYVILSQFTTKYRGDKKSVNKFYSTFRDLVYSYNDHQEVTAKRGVNNYQDILEYLVFTEQYESIEKIHVENPKDLLSLDIRPWEKKDLLLLLGLFKDKENKTTVLVDFLTSRFIGIVERVNRVVTLRDLIDHVFDVFYTFKDEQACLLDEIDEEFDNTKILMLLEKQILICFKVIERRVFNKRHYASGVDEILGVIRGKLVFDGYDFSYLTDSFKNKKTRHKEECFNDAKKEIDFLLNEMICKE